MKDWIPDWTTALWIWFGAFIASQVEPAPGVWVGAFFGASFSAMTGKDRGFSTLLTHVFSCMVTGVYASQLVAEVVTLKLSMSRGAVAFALALSAQKLLGSLTSGDLLQVILKWKGLKS